MKHIVSTIGKYFQTSSESRPTYEHRGNPGVTAPLAVPVLLGSTHDAERRAVASFLKGTRWTLMHAASWPDLLRIVLGNTCPVILYDLALSGREWQACIFQLAAHEEGSCVVAISDGSDPDLWDEVVRHGGFDVLSRPLSKSGVLSMLDFAYIHWRSGRASLRASH